MVRCLGRLPGGNSVCVWFLKFKEGGTGQVGKQRHRRTKGCLEGVAWVTLSVVLNLNLTHHWDKGEQGLLTTALPQQSLCATSRNSRFRVVEVNFGRRDWRLSWVLKGRGESWRSS